MSFAELVKPENKRKYPIFIKYYDNYAKITDFETITSIERIEGITELAINSYKVKENVDHFMKMLRTGTPNAREITEQEFMEAFIKACVEMNKKVIE